MKIQLELDNGDIVNSSAVDNEAAIAWMFELCRKHSSGGRLIINEKNYGRFECGVFTYLATGGTRILTW